MTHISTRRLTFKTQRSQALAEAERNWLTRRAHLTKVRSDCTAILASMQGERTARHVWARAQFEELQAALAELHEFDAGPLFAALEHAVTEYRATAKREREALTTEDLLTAKANTQIANRAVAAAESAIAAALKAHALPRDLPDLALTIQNTGHCIELKRANRALLDEVIADRAPSVFHESKAKDLDRWISKLPARDWAYLIANECTLGVVPSSVDYFKMRWEAFCRREGLEAAA